MKKPNVFNEFIVLSSKLDALALFFARLLSGSPQGLNQALGMGSRFEPEVELLPCWKRREGSLLRALVMQTQHCGRQLMQLEDPPNPAMIDGECITGLDNPREFSGGEGMRESEPHDLLLYMER